MVLVATGVVAYLISKAGSALLGVSAERDPGTWVVVAVGVALSALFAGIGSGLSLLCAVYDRQGNVGAPEPMSHVAIDRAPVTLSVPVQRNNQVNAGSDKAEIERNELVPRLRSKSKRTYRPGSLMDQLTRERHIFKDRSG